ncbi:MAG: ATP-grasp domain-containing protein [Methanohalobium sp.]|uniref:ATP-grasp domain-containing protein n=1 Tax=Methanohalobium sp. TaxID=2837493 RepID=UPI00397E119B
MQNVLIIGCDTRNIACSASKSEYNVYSIDAFCDFDLTECAVATKKIPSNYADDVKTIPLQRIEEWIAEFDVDFDAIVLGSGFELINQKRLPYRLLNNSQQIMNAVTDKYRFASRLESLDIPHPVTYSGKEHDNIDTRNFPVMVKPNRAGGGLLNRKVGSPDELESVIEGLLKSYPSWTADDLIIQEFEIGIPASVSIISTETEACAIALNEQLIGESQLTDMGFAYCGNITPFETSYHEMICETAKQLVLEFGLIGSNGVDFIITENGPVILEINPRFQGSLDTVELATGMNLFDAHVKSFSGILPDTKPHVNHFAGKAIVYSKGNLFINERIFKGLVCQNTVDIPNLGHNISTDEPMVSVVHTGYNRNDVTEKLRKSVDYIRNLTDSCYYQKDNKSIQNLNTKLIS